MITIIAKVNNRTPIKGGKVIDKGESLNILASELKFVVKMVDGKPVLLKGMGKFYTVHLA